MSSPAPAANLEGLLDYIRRSRGADLTGYKRTTLERRVAKRMADVGVTSYDGYKDLLEVQVDEFTLLFNTILINVTSFFRDIPAWDFLRDSVIPQLVDRKLPGDPIRVWSAGCSSGEEAYTIAMLLAEALGLEGLHDRVKIYATDVDDDALSQARQGTYTERDLADVPEDLRDRYFEPVGTRVALRTGLRRAVIFGRHDLTTDPPIGRLDLLVCRNTLMYFNAEVQAQIVDRFHFAVEDEGYLFLGKAEMLLSRGDLFKPANMRLRVFQKTRGPGTHDLADGSLPYPDGANRQARIARYTRLRDLIADVAPVASLAVDINGVLVASNAEARALFGLSPNGIGQLFQNLDIAFRPVELQSRLEQAYSERRAVHIRSVERPFVDGQSQYLDITVTPVANPDETLAGAAITFADVTSSYRLREELRRSRDDLETTYEELRSTNEELETTNEELQSSNEELETTNEELQSTNEELETTNEELQSSNEELETMNEELRSTNEEFEAANQQLQTRAVEVETINERLNALLFSLRSAVVVIDRELLVRLWNHAAEDLWGLRSDEVEGKAFATLEVGLPVLALQDPIRACLDDRAEREVVEIRGSNRTGRPSLFRVVCVPIAGPQPPSGVALVIDELGP